MPDDPTPSATISPPPLASSSTWRGRVTRLLLLVGPGLVVMLADTDAGSVITAAQSGATYRYQLVLVQVVLIPILYLVQEITVRLGLVTGQGHGALIRQAFGAKWAALSAGTLFIACIGALITEFAGVAGVGGLVGLPRVLSVGASALLLIGLVLGGRYQRIEYVAIAIGALELLFIPAAIIAHPHGEAFLSGLAHPLQMDGGYLRLLAANVGATIIPWMIFYQQEAVIAKGRRGLSLRRALRSARLDTAVGAVLCQFVTIAIIVCTAATIGLRSPGATLNSIGDIAAGLAPFLGGATATILFGLGMAGAAMLAALVVSLAGAWGVSEVLGWRRGLNESPRRAIGFYGLVVVAAVTGATLVLAAPNLVDLSVDIEVMNSCLLPIVLGFLLALERRALPSELRMRGARRAGTYVLALLVIVFGLYTATQALVSHL